MQAPSLQAIKRLSRADREALLARAVPRMVEEYLPHVPHPPQVVFLLQNGAEVMYGGAAGGGKALQWGVNLPTPTGWTTIADVQVGDYVLDERGQPTCVLAKSELMLGRRCLRVTFSDGQSVVCDEDHLWTTLSEADRQRAARSTEEYRAARRASRGSASHGRAPGTRTGPAATDAPTSGRTSTALRTNPWQEARTRTAEQLRAELAAGGRPHAVPCARPLDLPPQDLPVDPYVLGLWVGDGDTRRGHVTVGGQDQKHLLGEIRAAGYQVTPQRGAPTHFKAEGLREALVGLGLCGTKGTPVAKFVPPAYLRSSFEQRLALLQGIVDSDGHVDARGQVEVTWTSYGLTVDLLELLATLGVKATAREGRATIDGRDCGPKWSVKWLSELPCARLPRKLARQKRDGFRGTHDMRYVVAVEEVPTTPVQCIKVDAPSGLFLAGRAMIPTHNSDALLFAALQYADVPGYSALILRKTYKDLTLPDAIMDRAGQWLRPTRARPIQGGVTWEFPTSNPDRPARLTFGHLMYHGAVQQYQGAAFQFVGIDELTQFEERTYEYMFSRIRRPALPCAVCKIPVEKTMAGAWEHKEATITLGVKAATCATPRPNDSALEEYRPSAMDGVTTLFDVPLRMRAASNPGGTGHTWVRKRFVDDKTRRPGTVFVPARLDDNPSLDQESYRQGLSHLGATERARLEKGDWDVNPDGALFQRHWFEVIQPDQVPADVRWVRYWDLASTAAKDAADPDWTAGAKLGVSRQGIWYVADVRRARLSPLGVQQLVQQTAAIDGRQVRIYMEQEPGSAGVNTIDEYRRMHLRGYAFYPDRPSGGKDERARPWAAQAEAGNVKLVAGQWVDDFLDEAEVFPNEGGGVHDDQIDAVSGAFGMLVQPGGTRIIS